MKELDPNRFTAFKKSPDSSSMQWDAVHNLTFKEAHSYSQGEVEDKDGYMFDTKQGKKYRWIPCLTECYKGDFK